MPRCITGLSFCLHFAEPKIGSVLVTRCCVSVRLLPYPLFSLSLSIFLPSAYSFSSSLVFADRIPPIEQLGTNRSTPNPPPLSYPSCASVELVAACCRCSFVFGYSPLHLRSALFLKDRYYPRTSMQTSTKSRALNRRAVQP